MVMEESPAPPKRLGVPDMAAFPLPMSVKAMPPGNAPSSEITGAGYPVAVIGV